MNFPIIQLKKVFKVYQNGLFEALRDISLKVEKGEWLTIMGPSGSGKSTLLHLMGGLDLPTQGQVIFNGKAPRNSRSWGKLRAQNIGIVFQTFNLLPTLNTIENVMLPMFGVIQGIGNKQARAIRLLKQVGLENRVSHHPYQLSAGERQRLAIARSLANTPSLLLADEPTGNLDSQNKKNIMNLLKDIQRQEGISLVMVTHDANLTNFGDRVVHLIDGQLNSGLGKLKDVFPDNSP